MAELIPVAQARRLRDALAEYLGTTFSLADPETRAALEDFLAAPSGGMFRGPYVRLRVPFRPAADGWRESLEWYEGFTPYGHQARAFARLSSAVMTPEGERRRPQPTLVTTGTGSGKTEAFLYPILDHVLRANRQGVRGTKAIILYPMNALADDQAGRLAGILTAHPELAGITAARYTGQKGPERSRVSEDGLITSRQVIRDDPPDILLTNYKMLDQLLLRHHDAPIWRASALSLQYLVLDEFHTYDGAQGTDVAMLLRRLGLALKAHWPSSSTAETAALTKTDRQRPLGRVTPVATSATLGDKGDPAQMLDFARTVFGEDFGPEAVVVEDRLNAPEWIEDAPTRIAERGWQSIAVDSLTLANVPDHDTPGATARAVLAAIYQEADGSAVDLSGADHGLLLDLAKAHPVTTRLLEAAGDAVDLTELAHAVVPRGPATTRAQARASRTRALTLLLTTLSHVRAVAGRAALSVDTHLWIRELTRVDRLASGSPAFCWGDDGVRTSSESEAGSTAFPALYCRHCHRSGWGVVLAPTGSDLDISDTDIRRRHLARDDRFRPLLHAPDEDLRAAEQPVPVDNLMWFLVDERRLVAARPEQSTIDGGNALPVLTHRGLDAGESSSNDVCPSCLQRDGIRFLGSAIATMLSVTLSALFGTDGLDEREKKALVFTDSVQDAAHRAGFIQARSHTLTLRAVLRQALSAAGSDAEGSSLMLDELVRAVLAEAGTDPQRRYRLLPPDLADKDVFAPFWRPGASSKDKAGARRRVEKRLNLDVMMEFGLRSGVGRTLERTGAASAGVDVAPALLLQAARDALDATDGTGTLEGFAPTERDLVAWVRGVLERMRTRGAIEHDWFRKFRQQDGNRWTIWGGRPKHEGMPAFPRGASAPSYPRIGGAAVTDSDMDPLGSPRGWYATWTAATLNVAAPEGAVLVRHLFTKLERRGVIAAEASETQATTYHLRQESITVRAASLDDLTGGRVALICTTCHDITMGHVEVVDQLDGAPCLVQRCDGRLSRHADGDNFYRRMYADSDIRRVIAREHTSLLPDEVRTSYEEGFKSSAQRPDAPNVLVATPTLEMGIDIGDLSAVMLASLPRSVANYLQRVGRAGRLTGNSLALAFVTARGDQLPRFADPLATVNGQVRPPATYLGAEEILRRQYLASVADVVARTPHAPRPARVTDALGSSDDGSYLGALIREAEENAVGHLDRFLGSFDALSEEVQVALRVWAMPTHGLGTSPLAERCHAASATWRHRVETLEFRRQEIEASLPDLRQRASTPAATEDDKREVNTAEAAHRLTGKQLADLRGDFWISALEEFGLLPNYTLLDDTVRLSVSVSWIDPDTQAYDREAMTIERASAQALREFAPGSVFYARGYAIDIDAVDIGRNGEAIRTWAICPGCGYGVEVGEPGVEIRVDVCPRCAATGIADIRQRLDVVELTEVSSEIRREEATIGDARDERDRASYQLLLTTQHTSDQIRRQWYVEDYGFGAKYVRNMVLTWFNLGPRNGRGTTLTIGGNDLNAPLFRLCDSCGKRDTSTGRNSPREHRPWCPRRKEQSEHTRAVALSRTLRTEGLLMRLPSSVSLGDQFALPSLRTALKLALREHLGGAPDHLAVETVVDSDADGTRGEAILLHDVVPGGTGYLAELADPATVWGMLHAAWQVVRDCPCQAEDKLACERCLLPFATTHEIAQVSRAAAERHLRTILLSGAVTEEHVPDEVAWQITEEEPARPDHESQLEQKFRQVLRTRLETMGATIQEFPTDSGNSWQITLGGGARWRLEPQQFLHGSRPDFVLSSERPDVPSVAIFTDGWRYHASPDINRLADDAEKRATLRLANYQVIGLTWEDLDAAPGAVSTPGWYVPAAVQEVLRQSNVGLSAHTADRALQTGLEQLLAWIEKPDEREREALARWLPILAVPRSVLVGLTPSGTDLSAVALASLDGAPAPGGPSDPEVPAGEDPSPTFVWRQGTIAVAFRIPGGKTDRTEVAVVIDDDTAALSEGRRVDWRAWLHLSNLLSHRLEPTRITTRSLVEAGRARLGAGERGGEPTAEARGPWADLITTAVGPEVEVLELLHALADEGVAPPVVGTEVEVDGEFVVLDVAWVEQRVAVLAEDPPDDLRMDLARSGWLVVRAELDAVRSALQETSMSEGAGA